MSADTAPARHSLTVAAGEAGERVDRLLAARLPALSRSRLKALIEGGALSLAGAKVEEPSRRVKPGERYDLTVPVAAPARPLGQAIALAIVYEDAHLIVVDKPAGLVVHPAPGNPDRTLVNALIAHCGESLQGIGGEKRPGIVHRLDKDTSGLLVAAKTEPAHRALSAAFAAREIERAYKAVVWGLPTPAAGRLEGAIGRSPRNRKKMAVVARGGKPAVTHYRLARAFGGGLASLLDCRLETGRTHQIRVHLAAAGHPLLGDPLYGRAREKRLSGLPEAARAALAALPGQALQACRLGFRHPASGAKLCFERDYPQALRDLIATLESL